MGERSVYWFERNDQRYYGRGSTGCFCEAPRLIYNPPPFLPPTIDVENIFKQRPIPDPMGDRAKVNRVLAKNSAGLGFFWFVSYIE